MATIAVFIALGGGTYAATHLGKNSVGTKQIKNGAVTGAKVADNSLTGADIDARTLGTVQDSAHLGGSPASAFQRAPAWAFVRADGTIGAQSGGVTVTEHSANAGYFLDMGVPVAGRLLLTTTSAANLGTGAKADPEACENPAQPDGGVCSASGDPSGNVNDGDHVFVRTFDDAGTPADGAFYVAVFG